MSPTAEHLYQSALALTEADRVALAEALLDVPEQPSTPALIGEAYLTELRFRSTQSGEGVWSALDEARNRVHDRLGIRESTGG